MITSIEEVRHTLEKRIGRAPSIRQAVGREQYFIQDPLTSHIQRGDHKFNYDYRNGLLLDLHEKFAYFSLVHCPAIARHFKNNFVFQKLIIILTKTKTWRTDHAIGWSSISKQSDIWITSPSHKSFINSLLEFNSQIGFKNDLFFGLNRRIISNPNGKRGNFISIKLGEFSTIPSSSKLIDVIMPLLGWCLPSEEHPGRTASLAAALCGANIAKTCEFQRIANAPNDFYSIQCSERLQGAHIRPHARGGSASLQNGLWLCHLHHKASEGKINGTRDNCRWNNKTEQGAAANP